MINYYKDLGLKKDATDEDIKREYKRLARIWHPDRNKDNKEEAERMFKKISSAYSVLSDKTKKDKYDRFGEAGLNQDDNNKQYQQHFNFNNTNSFFGGSKGMDGLFEQFFGEQNFHNFNRESNMFERQQRTHFEKPKNSVVRREYPLSYEEMYNGCKKKIIVNRSLLNKTQNKITIILEIKPRTVYETSLRFPGKGDEIRPNVFQDIVFVLKEKKHPIFKKRNSFDLVVGLQISLIDAIVGFERKITGIDGNHISFVQKEITSPGQEILIKGKGLPKSSSVFLNGDLFVSINVIFPKGVVFSEEQKRILKTIIPK